MAKRIITYILTFIIFCGLFGMSYKNSTATAEDEFSEQYQVSGGQVAYDFFSAENLTDNFDTFVEYSTPPYALQEKLYFNPRCENKVILKDKIFGEFDISADISVLVDREKIDFGFYFGIDPVAPVYSQLDGIKGYCLTFEKGRNKDFYAVKVHRFSNGYLGTLAEVENVRYVGNQVNFRVVYKDKTIHAFVNDGKTPVMSYEIGVVSGKIGLRCFYCSNTVENLKITAPILRVNRTELEGLVAEVKRLPDKFTQASKNALDEAVIFAETALDEIPLNSYKINAATERIIKAKENLVEKRAYQDMMELLSQSSAIENPNGKVYTKNSWASLQHVVSVCQRLNENSTEDEISYYYAMLSYAKENLIAYE